MKKFFAAAAFMALTPAAVQAQSINAQEGFYIGAGGGAAWFIGSTAGVATSTGWAVGGKAGYDFVGPRLELEVGYGEIPFSAPAAGLSGQIGQGNLMVNLLYDFMPTSVITPYIGAGAGVAFVPFGNFSLANPQFAYQGMVGVAYNVNEQFRFIVEGRYVGTTNPSINTPFGNASFQNNNILALAGVTYKFTAPPPAPPPPPPQTVAPPSFMVFFDWDRANLSAQALTTIKQAAGAYKQKGNARITATGHTDTSGTEAYNMALSLRRANAVKDALVREGVPATAIAVVGRGEQGLLVQTGPNVREPQNRRVEIVIQ